MLEDFEVVGVIDVVVVVGVRKVIDWGEAERRH